VSSSNWTYGYLQDPTDTFEDIPLDTRHHKVKVRHRFPKEWILTKERKAELAALRRQAYEIDKAKKEAGGLIDGIEKIKELAAPEDAPEPVVVRRGVGKPTPRGKQSSKRQR